MWIIMRFQVEKTLRIKTNKKTHKISLFWVLFFGPIQVYIMNKSSWAMVDGHYQVVSSKKKDSMNF
jgi:hypothetical protein